MIEAQCVYLFPDRWIEGVPLGIRNTINRNNKYPFMISKSLIARENIVFRIHNSKLWGDTMVIDPDKTLLHFKFKDFMFHKDIIIKYLNLIAIRIKFGCGDLADRNFLLKNQILYSIDEETISDPLVSENLMNELRTNKYNFLKNKITEYYDFIHKDLIEILFKAFKDT